MNEEMNGGKTLPSVCVSQVLLSGLVFISGIKAQVQQVKGGMREARGGGIRCSSDEDEGMNRKPVQKQNKNKQKKP